MKLTIEYNKNWDPASVDRSSILPLVEAAVARLGYIRPEASHWFAECLMKHFFDGKPWLEVQRSGERVPKDHLVDLGYEKWMHLSYEALYALTDIGKVNPEHAFQTTATQVIMEYHRIGRLDRIKKVAKQRPWVRWITTPNRSCPAAAKLDGKVLPVSAVPSLPLVNCTREVCSCSLQSLSGRDLIRYGLTPDR